MGFFSALTGGGNTGAGDANRYAGIADDIIKEQFGRTKEMLSPYLKTGSNSLDLLGTYLGLPNGGTGYKSRDDIFQEIYTNHHLAAPFHIQTGEGTKYDWDKLNKHLDEKWAEQEAKNEAAKNDPNYGMLLKTFTMDDYEESPNYQFNLEEGQKAVDRAAAARGNYLSPTAVKELERYSQDLASNEYLNSYNMFENNKSSIFEKLMGGVGIGQTGTQQQQDATQNYTNARTGVMNSYGNIAVADANAKAQKRQSAFNNLVNLGSMGLKAYGVGI